MADFVTPEQYPDLTAHTLTSDAGPSGGFVGEVIEEGQPCERCGTDATVTVLRGPQSGLALDSEDAPVKLELSWCSRHGDAGRRLVTANGAEYTGL